MARRLSSQHSFTGGEISPLMASRSDLKVYKQSVKTSTNRYASKLGPSIKRTGSVYIQDIEDETKRPRAWSFINSLGVSVTLEFGENYVVAYEDDVEVGVKLTTTYDEDEVELLSLVNDQDIIYCACNGINFRQITYDPDHVDRLTAIADVSWDTTSPAITQPDLCCIFQQRLILIDSTGLTGNASKSGNLKNFTTGSDADDSFVINLPMHNVSKITAVSVSNILLIHTTTSEMVIEPTGTGGFIGPLDYKITQRSTLGCYSNRTVVTGQEVIFPGRHGLTLNRFYYDYEIDAFRSDVLSDFAEHLFISKIKDIAYSELSRRLFVVLESGDVLCATYVRERQILAWSKFTFSGIVESLSIGFDSDGKESVYLFIKRTINSATVRYVEILDSGDGTNILDSFVDSAKTFGVTPTAGTLYPLALVDSSGNLYNGGASISGIGATTLKGHGDDTAIILSSVLAVDIPIGSKVIVTGLTGTHGYVDLLNNVEHTVVDAFDNSGSTLIIIDLYPSQNDSTTVTSGTLAYGAANIYLHNDKTIVLATSHGLSTNDRVEIVTSGATAAEALVFDNVFEIVNEHTNYISFTSGIFDSTEVGNTITCTYAGYVDSLTGLSHLEGETVGIRAEGSPLADAVVSSGAVALETPVNEAVVGLKYTSTLELLPFDLGTPFNSTLGQPTIKCHLLIHINNSDSPSINGNKVPIRKANTKFNETIQLFTGYLDYGSTFWSNQGTVEIIDNSVLPSVITGIFGSTIVNSR